MSRKNQFTLNTLAKGRLFAFLIIVAIIVRVVLAVEMPVKIYMQAGYDDALSINQALTILAGKWLGPYGTGTLTKGLSFTFFLIVNHFSKLSYPLFLCLVNMAAAFAIVKALAPLIKNRYLSGLGFLFFSYSPATFTSDFSLRVYRNSLVFAVVLFVLAGILGHFLRRKEALRKRLPWAVILMAAFPFFWFLREDSIWLVPLYAVATVCTLFGIIVKHSSLGSSFKEGFRNFWMLLKETSKTRLIGNILLLLAPVLLTAGESLVISKINYEHYGIFTTNDRTKTSFARMTENLIQIDNSSFDSEVVAEDSGIWVSKKTFDKAQKVSPTFAKYKKGINWIYSESIWPHSWPVKNGELPGDMFVWGLREMFQREGLYKDGKANEKVFKKISQELEEGFESGKLNRKNMFFVSKQSNGKKLEDMRKVCNYIGVGVIETTFYRSYQTSYGGSIFVENQPAEVVLDLINVKSISTLKEGMEAEERRTKPFVFVINGIIWIYRIISPILLLASLGAILLFTIAYFKKKRNRPVLADYLIIFLGVLLTYTVYLFGVSWFATWAPGGRGLFMFFYTGAGVPLMQVIELLSVTLIFRNAKGKLFENKVESD